MHTSYAYKNSQPFSSSAASCSLCYRYIFSREASRNLDNLYEVHAHAQSICPPNHAILYGAIRKDWAHGAHQSGSSLQLSSFLCFEFFRLLVLYLDTAVQTAGISRSSSGERRAHRCVCSSTRYVFVGREASTLRFDKHINALASLQTSIWLE